MQNRILRYSAAAGIALALCFGAGECENIGLPSLSIEANAEATVVETGSCGENLTYVLDSDGVLTISGTGAMSNYSQYDAPPYHIIAPWTDSDNNVKSVRIEKGVTSIGTNAFRNCKGITSVIIPEGVVAIYDCAFLGCTGLTSITIPDSVASVSSNAFNGCSGLKSVTIGNGVASIGERAFFDCSSIMKLTIGNGVTSIGNEAFRNCTSLTSVVIPDTVSSIGTGAFRYCKSMTNLTIGKQVTSLNERVFNDCSSLTSVNIPDSVTSIGVHAFSGCTSMTSVTIGNGVTSIGESAFQGCVILTGIVIPDKVTSIGDNAFYSCTTLAKATIGSNVVSLGEYAFSGCTNLSSATIPDSVVSIGKGAFNNCTKLKKAVIGNNVMTIGADAFTTCTGLTSVTIGNTLDTLDSFNFADYTKLTAITVGADNEYFCSVDGVLYNKEKTELICYPANKSGTKFTVPDSVSSIGSYSFHNNANLTTVTIPESVTSIGKYAFGYCLSLKNIVIPDSVTTVGTHIFYDCDKLSSVTLGTGITELGKSFFCECIGLTNVIIPEGVTSIGDFVFYNCTSLSSLTIPASVETISATSVFYNCSSLKNVTFGGTKAQLDGIYKFNSNVSIKYLTHIWDTEYSYDEENHWYACTDCGGDKSELAPHDFVETGRTEATCAVEGSIEYECKCGATKTETIEKEEHSFSKEYSCDEAEHWYECTECGEKGELSSHTASDWIIDKEATTAENGSKHKECTGCKYVMETEDIEVVVPTREEQVNDFVERLYTIMLNRNSDEGKQSHVIGLLGGRTAADIAEGFVLGAELKAWNITNEEFVRRMYLTFLNREADPEGLAIWTAVLDKGCSYGRMFRDFCNSAEFKIVCDSYGINQGSYEVTEYRDINENITHYCSRMYTKALGRAYDVDGLNNWAKALVNGTETPESIAMIFLNGAEFQMWNHSDEVFVDRLYETLFNRPADADGKQTWLNLLSIGTTREQAIATFVQSQEFIMLKQSLGL